MPGTLAEAAAAAPRRAGFGSKPNRSTGCLFGVDHGVDLAHFQRKVRVDGGAFVVGDVLGAQRFDVLAVVFGFLQVLAVDDVHRAGRAEHCDLAGWPGEVHVRADGFGAHHDVCAAECLAQDDGDERHLRVGVGVDDLRATADDARMFLFGARLVARGVHQGDDRQVERVAQTHESCHFFG